MSSWRNGSRSRGQRRGAALVEFAMVVPVVFTFMFGMIELSRYVMVQQALTSAAQRGCRKAMLATTLSDQAVESAVRGYLGGSLGALADSDSVSISVSPGSLSGVTSGSDVTVRVQVNTADISWVKSSFLRRTGDLVLAGQSTLVRE
jgi:Flp pilus assembly protein TadG